VIVTSVLSVVVVADARGSPGSSAQPPNQPNNIPATTRPSSVAPPARIRSA